MENEFIIIIFYFFWEIVWLKIRERLCVPWNVWLKMIWGKMISKIILKHALNVLGKCEQPLNLEGNAIGIL